LSRTSSGGIRIGDLNQFAAGRSHNFQNASKVPDPAEAMVGWRVADAAKNSRIEPCADMAGPMAGG
jgi:hypothetical protein